MSTGIKWIASVFAILVAAFAAYFVNWNYQHDKAKAEAEQFCATVVIGSNLADTKARAASMKGVRHASLNAETEGQSRFVALFPGPIYNAFACELDVSAGKITDKRVRDFGD